MIGILKKLVKLRLKPAKLVNVSYLRVDPRTRILIIYNNKEGKIGRVEVEVKNTDGHVFTAPVPSLGYLAGYSLPLEKLLDKNDAPFTGTVKSITARTRYGKEHFVPNGTEFRRTR